MSQQEYGLTADLVAVGVLRANWVVLSALGSAVCQLVLPSQCLAAAAAF